MILTNSDAVRFALALLAAMKDEESKVESEAMASGASTDSVVEAVSFIARDYMMSGDPAVNIHCLETLGESISVLVQATLSEMEKRADLQPPTLIIDGPDIDTIWN